MSNKYKKHHPGPIAKGLLYLQVKPLKVCLIACRQHELEWQLFWTSCLKRKNVHSTTPMVKSKPQLSLLSRDSPNRNTTLNTNLEQMHQCFKAKKHFSYNYLIHGHPAKEQSKAVPSVLIMKDCKNPYTLWISVSNKCIKSYIDCKHGSGLEWICTGFVGKPLVSGFQWAGPRELSCLCLRPISSWLSIFWSS